MQTQLTLVRHSDAVTEVPSPVNIPLRSGGLSFSDMKDTCPNCGHTLQTKPTLALESETNGKPKQMKKFEPPTLPMVLEKCQALSIPVAHGRAFFFHFDSNGWLVSGKTPMKNWVSALRGWHERASQFTGKGTTGEMDFSRNRF